MARPRDEEAAMLTKRALDTLSPELKALAEELGVSYSTVKAWRSGNRSPSPENLEKLANLSEGQADDLLALAARLRRAAEEGR